MNQIAFEPAFSLPAIVLAGAVAILAGAVSLIRAPRSAPFRVAALFALLALLLNPQIRVAERTALADIAVIIEDESASNRLDQRAGATRVAADALEAKLRALGDVELVRTRVGGEEESRLGEALDAALTDNPRARLSVIFVVTDGQATDHVAAPAAPESAPVHILLTGRPSETDRKVTLLRAPRYGIVKEGAEVSFRIDDLGPDETPLEERGQAIVSLRVNGEQAVRQPVPVGADVSFTAPLPHPGRSVIELEVEPAEGELTTKNNIVVLPIAAIRDRLRVLLISGEPHAGERVWRNLLKSDPAIDLVHFTILRPIEKAQSDSALERELALIEFPQDELFIEKLAEFDLVIFDRYTYRGVLNAYHFDNLARYVEGGGAVLVSSGPEFSGYLSLASRRNFSYILPAMPAGDAIDGPYRPKISDVGERHPVTAGLPEADFWGRWLRIAPSMTRSGATLMTDGDGRPLLVLDRVGEGRVGLIQSDHVWLWARGFDGGGPHAELLRRISHWLMKEPDLEEEQLLLVERNGDLVIDRRTIEDVVPPVAVTFPDGRTEVVALAPNGPGRFEARIAQAPQGLYRAKSDGLFAIAAVGLAAPPELQDVVMTAAPLEAARAATKGGVFRVRTNAGLAVPDIRRISQRAAERAGPGWAGIVGRNAHRTDSVADRPIASPWVWLLMLALSLAGAWLIEGRGGKSRAQS
jgi:predicted Rdx family selenoprotein